MVKKLQKARIISSFWHTQANFGHYFQNQLAQKKRKKQISPLFLNLLIHKNKINNIAILKTAITTLLAVKNGLENFENANIHQLLSLPNPLVLTLSSTYTSSVKVRTIFSAVHRSPLFPPEVLLPEPEVLPDVGLRTLSQKHPSKKITPIGLAECSLS